MGEPRTQTVQNRYEALRLAQLPLQSKLGHDRARQLTEPQSKCTGDFGRYDVSTNKQLPQPLRRRDGDSCQRSSSKRQVRHGDALELGEHRNEVEEVYRMHERRKDEIEVRDSPCDWEQPFVGLARGSPVGEDECEGA